MPPTCILLLLCGVTIPPPAPHPTSVWVKVRERDERLFVGLPVIVRPKTNGVRSILDLEASFGLNWGDFPIIRTTDYRVGFRYRF